MAEQKEFSTAAVCSITTGRTLCNFGDVQECAEWLAGHPIWTHEFANRDLIARLKCLAFEQHPRLPTKSDADAAKVGRDNWKAYLAEQELKFGKTLLITKGDDKRKESPVDSAVRMFGAERVAVITEI